MASNIRKISDEEKMRPNYAEFLVRKHSAKITLTKVGLIVFTIALLAVIVAILSKVPMAMLPVCVGSMALCWYLWRFTCIEYEYIIISASLEIHKIFGERMRKKIFEIKTSDIDKVAPLSAHPEVKDAKYDKVIDITSGKAKDEVYFVTFNNENGKGIIYLNVIKKTLDVFKYYKSSDVEYGNVQ